MAKLVVQWEGMAGGGGTQREPGHMEERFGDTTRGLPRAGGASAHSKLHHNVQRIWNDQEAGAAGN